jgi:hypothetical protein
MADPVCFRCAKPIAPGPFMLFEGERPVHKGCWGKEQDLPQAELPQVFSFMSAAVKGTPKSCRCMQCRLVKGREKTQPGQREMEERAFRRGQKVALRVGQEDCVVPAPRGDYHA